MVTRVSVTTRLAAAKLGRFRFSSCAVNKPLKIARCCTHNGKACVTLCGVYAGCLFPYRDIEPVSGQTTEVCLRGLSLKLNKRESGYMLQKFFFSSRVINEWNMLIAEITAGNSLSAFKRKLDGHLRDVMEFI